MTALIGKAAAMTTDRKARSRSISKRILTSEPEFHSTTAGYSKRNSAQSEPQRSLAPSRVLLSVRYNQAELIFLAARTRAKNIPLIFSLDSDRLHSITILAPSQN